MKKDYRFMVPANIALSIIAKSEADAIEKFNTWLNEISEINQIPEMVIDEPEITAKSVEAINVAVYLPENFQASPEFIVDVDELGEK